MEGFPIVVECSGLWEYYLSPCTDNVIVDAPACNQQYVSLRVL